VRQALPAGDHAVRDASGSIVAAVERKSIGDLAGGLNGGALAFELAQMAALPRALVVEDRYSALLKLTHAPVGFLPDLLARVQVRYPEIPSSSPRRARWPRNGPSAGSAPPSPKRSRWAMPGATTRMRPDSTPMSRRRAR
jgi:hypothetical protein